MDFIKNQEWRYATKTFDATKKVSAENIELLKKSIQLSASSFGLQLYQVLLVENQEVREKLKAVSWNQSQITDASHVFVLCNIVKPNDQHVDTYIDLIAETRGISADVLADFGKSMKGAIASKSEKEQFQWTKNQTYIALGNLLAACAELKIDACPMEGFDPSQYNEILGLTEKNLNAALAIPVGYRSEEDTMKDATKVRKPLDEMFINI